MAKLGVNTDKYIIEIYQELVALEDSLDAEPDILPIQKLEKILIHLSNISQTSLMELEQAHELGFLPLEAYSDARNVYENLFEILENQARQKYQHTQTQPSCTEIPRAEKIQKLKDKWDGPTYDFG